MNQNKSETYVSVIIEEDGKFKGEFIMYIEPVEFPKMQEKLMIMASKTSDKDKKLIISTNAPITGEKETVVLMTGRND